MTQPRVSDNPSLGGRAAGQNATSLCRSDAVIQARHSGTPRRLQQIRQSVLVRLHCLRRTASQFSAAEPFGRSRCR